MTKKQLFWIRAFLLSFYPYSLIAGFFWGFLAHNIPPFPASMPAEELAQYFRDNAFRMRLGYGVSLPFWSMLMVWAVGAFCVMRRVEKGDTPWSFIQLMGGSFNTVVMSVAAGFWVTAAMRPETDPKIIQMLYDVGWLEGDLFNGVAMLQNLSLFMVFYRDDRPVRLVPKWALWFGVFLSLSYSLEMLLPFFRSGPFGWGGLINYGVGFCTPFVWMIIMTFYLQKAAVTLYNESQAEVAQAARG